MSACPEFILAEFSSLSHTSACQFFYGVGGRNLTCHLSSACSLSPRLFSPPCMAAKVLSQHILFLHPLILWVYKLLVFGTNNHLFSLFLSLKKFAVFTKWKSLLPYLLFLNMFQESTLNVKCLVLDWVLLSSWKDGCRLESNRAIEITGISLLLLL